MLPNFRAEFDQVTMNQDVMSEVEKLTDHVGKLQQQVEAMTADARDRELRLQSFIANLLNDAQNILLGPVNAQSATLDMIKDLVLRVEQAQAAAESRISASITSAAAETQRVANLVNGAENRLLGSLGEFAKTLTVQTETDAGLRLLTARGLAALFSRGSRAPAGPQTVIAEANPVPAVSEQIKALREAAPTNIDLWLKAFEAGTAESQRSAEGSLSHEGHIGAGHFRMFVNVHGRGRILDVGCGQLEMPSYLSDWPIDQIAGLDPIASAGTHPFAFAHTLAEFIPWPDNSFETVVVATSLDHVYLLDRALAEIHRVLVPKGRLLLWSAMFDETPAYAPYGPAIVPPDDYHLFHPGRNWFYRLFEEQYQLIERVSTVASAEMLAYVRRD
jgi:SAM-dependent methyltransferase